ncbi:RNA polymerase, alpha chain C terminal domain [Lachnospiraceae bacterium RM5]|nr:RNA polymerase, alpha chain C terminal domain [Lachnospiraceae bacterium RM5]
MICNACGSEFNIENFDVCPYCLTPVNKIDESRDIRLDESSVIGIDAINEQVLIDQNEQLLIDEDIYTQDEYEVTEEDLIEEVQEEQQEILIDELGLSVRAVNAFRRAKIYTLSDLIIFLAENSVSDLKNVGAKTVKETEELLQRINSGDLDAMRKNSHCEAVPEKFIFENISSDVDYLSVDALVELGLSKKIVSGFIKNNIKCCERLRNLSKKDLSIIVGEKYLYRLFDVVTFLEKDIISLIDYVLEHYREDREYNVFLRRARGETLQEIANNPDGDYKEVITRERVRQIEKKYFKRLAPFLRELLYILKGGNHFISVSDILEIFDDDEYDQILLYASKFFDEFEYLDFAEVFIERNEDYSVEDNITNIITEIVADGIDINENREIIEEALIDNNYDYIDMGSVINLLKKNHYKIYGNFVVRGKTNYAVICMHIIREYFPDGIKLSQSETEQSEDLIKLRRIIDEKYRGLIVPTSDRALSSTLARSGLILRGRGVYILQENIIIDESLLLDIKNYIDNKDTNKVFYNEIYSNFEGVLNVMCGIDNYNYLHGVLALRYPDAYEYGRDYLLKNGIAEGQADSIADRIFMFICKLGRPVSRTELFTEFRGFSNVMLTMPFSNDSRLMQWEYNYYACTGILNISNSDIKMLEKCIFSVFDENNGYASDGLLYDKVVDEMPEFIHNNQIESEMNLHYIVGKIFEDRIDAKRPHICEKGKIDISSTKNVVLYLLNDPDTFTYKQYFALCDRMKWSRVTAGAVLTDIEEDYARISSDGYIKNTRFDIPKDIENCVSQIIEERIEDGILPLLNIDFDDFPEWEYQWNEFVLETLVERCYDNLKVIQPTMKDRRYQRGILVSKELNITTYPEIVANKMLLTGNEKMSESQFLSFLVIHNLARKAIPNELDNSDYVKKDGEYYFVLK